MLAHRIAGVRPVAPPVLLGDQRCQADDDELAEEEQAEFLECAFRLAVGVQADTQLVHSEPGPGGPDISADSQRCKTAVLYPAVPASVQDQGRPEDDQ